MPFPFPVLRHFLALSSFASQPFPHYHIQVDDNNMTCSREERLTSPLKANKDQK